MNVTNFSAVLLQKGITSGDGTWIDGEYNHVTEIVHMKFMWRLAERSTFQIISYVEHKRTYNQLGQFEVSVITISYT